MARRTRPETPRPDVTVTIPGFARFWVAEALLEAIRKREEEEEPARKRARRRGFPPPASIADQIRDLYNQIVL